MREKNSSKNKTDWETPWNTFHAIQKFTFEFNLDVCASPLNTKHRHYFIRDALDRSWLKGDCFMNPPYGKTIGNWLEKAVKESKLGANVACLIPSRTDPAWWHEWVMKYASQVFFIKGRIQFVGAKDGAMYGSALAIYRPKKIFYRGPKFKSIELPLK